MPLTRGHKRITTKVVTSGHKLPTTQAEDEWLQFGNKVFEARQKLLWTRQDLCQRTRKLVPKGLHENTIYNIEVRGSTGNLVTRRVIVETITAALGCPYPWEDQGQGFTKNSLAQFIKDCEVLNRIDHDIAAASELRITPPDSFLDLLVERMDRAEIKTLSEMEKLLTQRRQLIANFGIRCYTTASLRLPFVPRGVGIACLQIIRVLEKYKVVGLTRFLDEYSPDKKANPTKRARELKAAYDQARRV